MLTAWVLSGQTITRKRVQDACGRELQFMEELGEIEASSRRCRDERHASESVFSRAGERLRAQPPPAYSRFCRWC